MPDKYHALRGVLIAALLPAIFAGKMDSAESALTEQTLKAVEECEPKVEIREFRI